jgi:CRP-like cAMP-binding protein
MITTTDCELATLLQDAEIRTYKRKAILNAKNKIPNEVFFVNKGLLRIMVEDVNTVEHTIHFAMEGQFIAEYAAYILKQPSIGVLPRKSIEWGYTHMAEGNKLGRLIAEYYFIYQDTRIRNTYVRSAVERYNAITDIFPDIHNRAPQHMIASYLGITPIHLSRLKRKDRKK